MAALSFVARGKPKLRTRMCCVATCHRSGLYRVEMLDRLAGYVCPKHRLEWERAWEREVDPGGCD